MDLFCTHSFHTYCYYEMTWNESSCKCGVRPVSDRMEAQFRERADAKQETYVTETITNLKATEGFAQDLRELKKNVAHARKAQKSLFTMCRARRAVFIEETRPFIERVHELQKDSVKGVRAAPESKLFRREYLSVRRKVRMMERKYPQFSPHRGIFSKLRLPPPWDMKYNLRKVGWRMKRVFRTMPRLF